MTEGVTHQDSRGRSARGMGGRVPRDSERRREILTAARDLLAVQGFERTTMAEVGAAVGVVESAVYRYFSSKRELFHECVRTFYEPIIDDLKNAERAIEDPRALLRYTIWRHLRSFDEGPELNRIVVVHARQLEEDIDQSVHELNRQYTSVFIRTIERGMATGVFRADLDARLARDMVYGMIEHVWLRHHTQGVALDVDRLTAQVLELVEPGLLAHTRTLADDDVRGELRQLTALLRARMADSPTAAGSEEADAG